MHCMMSTALDQQTAMQQQVWVSLLCKESAWLWVCPMHIGDLSCSLQEEEVASQCLAWEVPE